MNEVFGKVGDLGRSSGTSHRNFGGRHLAFCPRRWTQYVGRIPSGGESWVKGVSADIPERSLGGSDEFNQTVIVPPMETKYCEPCPETAG